MEQRRPSGPKPIQSILQSFLRDSGLGLAPRQERVFRAWRDALGDALAKQAVPVRFRGGDLTVEVLSAPHLQELKSFTGEGFRRKANAKLGAETIRRVVFKLRG